MFVSTTDIMPAMRVPIFLSAAKSNSYSWFSTISSAVFSEFISDKVIQYLSVIMGRSSFCTAYNVLIRQVHDMDGIIRCMFVVTQVH